MAYGAEAQFESQATAHKLARCFLATDSLEPRPSVSASSQASVGRYIFEKSPIACSSASACATSTVCLAFIAATITAWCACNNYQTANKKHTRV